MVNKANQNQVNINFLDISFLDGIIMMLLLQHEEPIKRYILFLEVNHLLEHSTFNRFNKFLSNNLNTILDTNKNLKFKDSVLIASFYNHLKKLNRMFLVKVNKNKKGKIDTIEKTPLTKPVIISFYQMFTSNFVYSERFTRKVLKYLTKLINYIPEKSLVCGVFDFFYSSTWNTDLMTNYSTNIYFITEMERDDDYFKNLGFTDIKFSNINNHKIGEPEDIFDFAFIPNYSKNLNIRGLTRIEILKELVRVTKRDKAIVITCFSKIQTVTNFYAKTVINQLNRALSTMIFTPDELQQDMISANLVKIKIDNFKGRLIGIGWVA